ncbi:FadR/GntR family transcriptional regulator [Streptomyces sp. NPDC058534]|uniref:FadR/GntR family transcriptional regulator n=1 Tax=Streptomyces sp. NPDC058534 TaxID=3346541 RepID=UPI003660821E
MARATRTEDVQVQIKRLILERGLAPGDPLPTEAELVALIDVSRNSVREALKALQAVCIVEIRHGYGTYVGSLSLDPFVEGMAFRAAVRQRLGEPSLYELMEVREALEAGLIAQVARVIPQEDIAVLSGLVAEMEHEAERDGRVSAATDRAFHLALYRPINNHLLSEVLDAFWAALRRVRTELADDHQDPEVTCRQHRAIVDAFEARDGERAAEAMRHHFGGIRKRLTENATRG